MASTERMLDVCGWGTARADLATIAALRNKLPAWAPEAVAGHFLKHADEQTVLAVNAVDQLIASGGLDASSLPEVAVIAAPEYIGRIAGCGMLERFSRSGGPAVSPHLIAQHSLHSISGALSILLATRQPNLGVGGTDRSVGEALLAAMCFPAADAGRILVVSTGFNPEPQLDPSGQCVNQPVCYAAALALRTRIAADTCGYLRLLPHNQGKPRDDSDFPVTMTAAVLCQSLDHMAIKDRWTRTWPLPTGSGISLELHPRRSVLAAAA